MKRSQFNATFWMACFFVAEADNIFARSNHLGVSLLVTAPLVLILYLVNTYSFRAIKRFVRERNHEQ